MHLVDRVEVEAEVELARATASRLAVTFGKQFGEERRRVVVGAFLKFWCIRSTSDCWAQAGTAIVRAASKRG
ncbi:MAG: hypothetical protein ACJAYX_002028 [Planctomycetota bacterium]|jgi:hypothetical protein